jgi:ADP-heptose:LPS heptosyltransferase
MKKLRKNIKKYYRERIIRMVDFLAKITSPHKPDTKPTLLILRHDAIGDYILFRNYLPYIRNHSLYKDYKIVLVGNVLWQDLAEDLDKNYVDQFIFFNVKKFTQGIFYRYRILKKIYAQQYDEFVYPVYAREYQAEHLLAGLTVKKAVAYHTPPPDYASWQRKKMNTFYHQLIPPPENTFLFEGIKNQYFISQWLKQDIPTLKPTINFLSSENKNSLPFVPYLVLFPSASTSRKRWSTQHFATVAQHILDTYPSFHVVIAGSLQDNLYAEKIIRLCRSSDRIQNWTGKTSLTELAHLIKNAKLLISNDTVAVHIAASVQCPFICIAMGQDKGKFIPYPEELNVSATCLFSKDIAQSYTINDVPPEKVTEKLYLYLS